jgi:hypothetical protein
MGGWTGTDRGWLTSLNGRSKTIPCGGYRFADTLAAQVAATPERRAG